MSSKLSTAPGVRARLQIPPEADFVIPAVSFVVSYADRFNRSVAEQDALRTLVQAALRMVLQHNTGGTAISLDVGEAQGKLVVELINLGTPIVVGAADDAQHIESIRLFHDVSRHAEHVAIENLGRHGQSVRMEIRLGAGSAARAMARMDPLAADIPQEEGLTFRRLVPGDEVGLSRLFHRVYDYNYIHDVVYYPEKLRQMLELGDLISLGAVRPNGDLVGHVGLLRPNAMPPVYEAAMGVVDPAAKSRGVFRELFDRTMETVQSTPMQYCLFDLVTNHPYSQKHVARYAPCDLALFVGCQTRETQARLEHLGLGPDPEGMDRYSLLLQMLPRVRHPFGEEVVLPESIGERFGFLLEPIGVEWSPASRFEALTEGGNHRTAYHPSQGSVVFDMVEPGRRALDAILSEWRGLLRNGFQYAGIDVPLPCAGLGPLYEMLSSNGFFAAGFVPYHSSATLGFRFQALGPTRVAFEHIQVVSPSAHKLLELVRADYQTSSRV